MNPIEEFAGVHDKTYSASTRRVKRVGRFQVKLWEKEVQDKVWHWRLLAQITDGSKLRVSSSTNSTLSFRNWLRIHICHPSLGSPTYWSIHASIPCPGVDWLTRARAGIPTPRTQTLAVDAIKR
jgi:hypothetical protein